MTIIYHMVCIICQSLQNYVTILSTYVIKDVVGKKLIYMTLKKQVVFIDINDKLKIYLLETIKHNLILSISHCLAC